MCKRSILMVFLILLFVPAGCKKSRVRSQVRELMYSTIILPEKISCVYNGEVFPMPDSLRDKPKLIVYIDSTECSKCRITQFIRYDESFELARESGLFEVMLLLSAKRDERGDIKDHLLNIELFCPVYLDENNCFGRLNPPIVNNSVSHSFLVDGKGAIRMVGDPSSSKQMFELLRKRMNNLQVSNLQINEEEIVKNQLSRRSRRGALAGLTQ